MIGTVGVSAGALAFYPRGEFFVGTLVITVFVFSDTLDGTMARARAARARGAPSSTRRLDRVADSAVFAALLWWFAGTGDPGRWRLACLLCLVGSAVVSYAKARAEERG